MHHAHGRLAPRKKRLPQRQRHQQDQQRRKVVRVHERCPRPLHVLRRPRQPQHRVALPKELSQRVDPQQRPRQRRRPRRPLQHVLPVQVLHGQHHGQPVEPKQPHLPPRHVRHGDARRAPSRVSHESEDEDQHRMPQQPVRPVRPQAHDPQQRRPAHQRRDPRQLGRAHAPEEHDGHHQRHAHQHADAAFHHLVQPRMTSAPHDLAVLKQVACRRRPMPHIAWVSFPPFQPGFAGPVLPVTGSGSPSGWSPSSAGGAACPASPTPASSP